jgi:hypothetical protein
MVWNWVLQLVISLVLSYVLRPEPQTSPPPSLEDVQAPVAEEGKAIPVVFGRCHARDSNVVWYGDFRTSEIRRSGGKK